MSRLRIANLTKTFAGRCTALADISLSVAPGEFFCIVGPTNAGKTTLLKTVAGLTRPDTGRIEIDGQDVTRLEPHERGVSLLFQNNALFPVLSGFDNIAFPLRAAKLAEREVATRVRDVADLLKVVHLLDRLPRTFSGGEQQRVAIGRAIAHRSRLLMLDEPLTNLDARLRTVLRLEFKALHRNLGQTIVYVTHDQIEAMSLSDRVAVIDEGRLQQIGAPHDIYNRPANRFVAQFVGSPPMNLLDAELVAREGTPFLIGPGFETPLTNPEGLAASGPKPGPVSFGIRPEAVRAAVAFGPNTPVPGEVLWIERLGSRHVLDVRLGAQPLKVVVRPNHPVERVGPAWFGLSPRAEHLLDRDTGTFFASNI